LPFCRCRHNGKKTRGRKRHLLVDTGALLLVCMVHCASVQDRAGARLVLYSIDTDYPTAHAEDFIKIVLIRLMAARLTGQQTR
jgi:hypothetical protein